MRELVLIGTVIFGLLVVSCGATRPETARASDPGCAWTKVAQVPPDVVIEFIRGGQQPQKSFDQVRNDTGTANFSGAGDIWISLPRDGRVTWGSATESSKFWVYALAAGEVSVTARRLDAASPAGFRSAFNGRPTATGPGFLATGLTFPSSGCWEVTYTVGSAKNVFVVDVIR
jgi:hypothetical protein